MTDETPELLDVLGPVEVLHKDESAGQPILWGRRLLAQISPDQFEELRKNCTVVCISGVWSVITKSLTHQEAIKTYGPVTRIERGPRGGWKATTYGSTRFTSRYMKLREESL